MTRAPFEPKQFRTDREAMGRLFDRTPPHAIEAERSLLGSILLDPGVLNDVVEIVPTPDSFYKEAHGTIYKALVDTFDAHQSGDLVQLTETLRARGVLDRVGGTGYLMELAEAVPSAASAPYYARLIADSARLRKLIDAAGEILHDAYTGSDGTPDGAKRVIDLAEKKIFDIASEDINAEPESLKELLIAEMQRIDEADGKPISGVATGFPDLDEMMSGLQPEELTILAARPSMGKAQPLDARVLTHDGFVAMGELKVGDELASIDGAPSRVVGVYPQGERQVYRVTLSDGRSTECCNEHLWRVGFRGWDEPRVLSTGELRAMLGKQRYRNRVWVEPFAGVYGRDGRDKPLGLDPWLLGMLIGDGNIKGSAVRVSAANPDVVARIGAVASGMGMRLNPIGGCDYRIVQEGGARRKGVVGVIPNPIKEALVAWELWDRGADQKFIPPAMFDTALATRRSLLAGLIDSDGWVESFAAIRFGTASRRLADDVVRLMRSLGGTGSWTRKRAFYTYKGVKREGLPAYVCNLQHPDPASLGLTRVKGDRLAGGRTRQRRLNLVSVEPTRVCETQCIAVSHPGRLYITDDYIVTHNTAFSLNLAEQIAFGGVTPWQSKKGAKPVPVGIFSLEMSRAALTQRLLSSRSGVDSSKLRSGRVGEAEWRKLQEACDDLATAPIIIDDTPGMTVLTMRAKARRMKQRHDIGCIIIDYLQLLSSPGSARESRQVEVSEISRSIKALARELKIPVICLAQLNRGAESREGNRPRMSDLRESGSIEQDADVVALLHRESYYHRGDPAWDPNSAEFDEENRDKLNLAELIIAKQRNGPTGTVKLIWDDHIVRFKSHDATHSGGDYGFARDFASEDSYSGPAFSPDTFAPSPGPSAQATPLPPPTNEYRGFAPGKKAGPEANFRDGSGDDIGFDDDDLPPF